MRKLIRADGSTTAVPPGRPMEWLRTLIKADTLDTVSLRHMGHPLHVMLVDDNGHAKGLPVNVEATKLYHANCVKGTQHVIRGDVVVVPDDDFAPAPARTLPADSNVAWPFPERARAADSAGGEAA